MTRGSALALGIPLVLAFADACVASPAPPGPASDLPHLPRMPADAVVEVPAGTFHVAPPAGLCALPAAARAAVGRSMPGVRIVLAGVWCEDVTAAALAAKRAVRKSTVVAVADEDYLKRDRMTDQLYRKLAHEARHVEVGAFRLLLAFRWMKHVYLVAGLGSYTGFLANWAALLDGPDRIALMAYAAVLPYVMGAVFVVLDEMTDAFEWRHELDADRAAAARCRVAGRTCAGVAPTTHARLAKRLSDRYPPTPLRLVALSGGAPTKLQVWAPLVAGLLVAVVPIGLDMAFAFVPTTHPDASNAILGVLLVASLALAGGILLASSVSGTRDRPGAAPRGRSSSPDLAQAVALYSVRILSLGWTFVALAASLLLASCMVPLLASLPQGVPTPSAIIAILGILAVARWYWRSSTDWPSARGLARGGAGEFVRLACLSWSVTATAVFPFYDDLGGLGGALMRNPRLLAPELARLFAVEPGRMYLCAAIAGCSSLAIVALAWRGRMVGQRIAIDGVP